jgi:predicted small lipoprotein YifL
LGLGLWTNSRLGTAICYGAADFGEHAVTDCRSLSRLAVLGALAAALAVTGCGRKGPLDAPPSAALDAPVAPAPGVFAPAGAAAKIPSDKQARVTPEGQALAPPGQKKPIPPLDWLID